jgi:hypothetical protein
MTSSKFAERRNGGRWVTARHNTEQRLKSTGCLCGAPGDGWAVARVGHRVTACRAPCSGGSKAWTSVAGLRCLEDQAVAALCRVPGGVGFLKAGWWAVAWGPGLEGLDGDGGYRRGCWGMEAEAEAAVWQLWFRMNWSGVAGKGEKKLPYLQIPPIFVG